MSENHNRRWLHAALDELEPWQRAFLVGPPVKIDYTAEARRHNRYWRELYRQLRFPRAIHYPIQYPPHRPTREHTTCTVRQQIKNLSRGERTRKSA